MSTPFNASPLHCHRHTLAAGAGIPLCHQSKNQSADSFSRAESRRAACYLERDCIRSGAELRLFGVGRRQAEILINKVLAKFHDWKNLQPVSGRQPDQPLKTEKAV